MLRLGRIKNSQPGPSHIDDNEINQFQTGHGEHDGSSLNYEFKKIGQRTFNNRVIDRHYQVKFNPDQTLQGQQLSNIHDELKNMFDDVVVEAKEHLQGNDLGRVIIHHDKLINPIFVPLRPLDQLDGKTIMDHVENVLTSHQDLAVDENFYLDVGTMELPKGGRGNSISNLTGSHSDISRKRSIIEIRNQDNTCLARAILLGFLKTHQVTTQEWRNLTLHEKDGPIEDLVLKYKVCPVWYDKDLLKQQYQYRQTDLTMKFCHMAYANTFSWLSINDIPRFERVLDVDVLVVSARMGNKFVRVPPEDSSKQRLFVYLIDDCHFHAIVNICGFFGSTYFCEKCLKPYCENHSCEISCLVCKQKNCQIVMSSQVSCIKCHQTCRSIECFERHLEKKKKKNNDYLSICEQFWKCTVCKKVVKVKERDPKQHFCDEHLCQSCKQYVDRDHLCYIRALDPKKTNEKYIFFDIECTQEHIVECEKGYIARSVNRCKSCEGKSMPCSSCSLCENCSESWCGKPGHIPNLIVAQKVCPHCINDKLTPQSKCTECGVRCQKCNVFNKDEGIYDRPLCNQTCGFREVIFKGDNCDKKFGEWLFSKHHKDFTVFAHNLKAYDGYIILDYLISQSIHPDSIIYTGSKIMSMHVARGLNIRFMDSLNFLPMALKSFPEIFSLVELKKGYFPHYFNKTENQNYVGPYPEPHFYGCDSMLSEEREKFMKWYDIQVSQNVVFDFEKEMVEYCRSDVAILRGSMLTFRELLMSITGQEETIVNDEGEPDIERTNAVDPFNDITIASVCSRMYRTKFLTEHWEVKVRHDESISDWLPAKKLDGKMTMLIQGEWITETELQTLDYILEEKRFVNSPLAQVPSSGYNTDQFSAISIKWLEWLMEQSRQTDNSIFIQHALNDGEKHRRYKL